MPSKPAARSGRAKGGQSRKHTSPAQSRRGKALDPKHAQLLRHSFVAISAHGTIAGLIFYQKLFRSEPALRGMFHTGLEVQTRKLMEALEHTVAAIENPKTLVPTLEGLGRRHVTYGVQEAHYELVIKALLETFQEVLGSNFAGQVQELWREALDFVARAMIRGARKTQLRRANIGAL